MSWLAALHAPLDDGPRHADVRHPADAVACELAADDEAQPPAQRGDDERALYKLWPELARSCPQPKVREPSALLTPAQSSKRAIFMWGQSMPSRKEDHALLAADSEPSEWCGAALDVI